MNVVGTLRRICLSGSKKQGNQELTVEKDLSFWVLGNKWRREALGVTEDLNVILDQGLCETGSANLLLVQGRHC